MTRRRGSERAAGTAVGQLLRARLDTSFARSIGALWSGEAVILVIGAAQAIALARLMSPAELGTLTLAFAGPAFIFSIVDARSQEAVTRFLAEFRARERADRAQAVVTLALRIDVALMAAGITVTMLLGPWIIDTFLDGRLSVPLLGAAALGIAVGLPLSTGIAILMAEGRNGLVATSKSATTVVQAIVVVATVWLGGGVAGAIIGTVVTSLAGLATMMLLARSSMIRCFDGWRQPSSVLDTERSRVVRFIAFTNGSSLIATLAKDMDVLVLGFLTGAAQVGFYRLARSISRIATFLIGPLQALTYNRFARLAADGDLAALRVQVRRSIREVGLPLAAAISLVLFVAPHLVRLTATQAYDPAVGPLRWLVFAGAFLTATFWVRPLLLVLDEVRFILTATAAATILAVPLYIMLTRAAEASGTASARALATGVFGTGIAAVWGLRTLRLRMADMPRPGVPPAVEGSP